MKNQNKNQKNLNKVFAIILTILIVCVALLRINEQKRVEYYICYERTSSSMTHLTHEEISDRCQERND